MSTLKHQKCPSVWAGCKALAGYMLSKTSTLSLLLQKVTVCFLSKFLLKARHSARACNLSTLKTEAGG